MAEALELCKRIEEWIKDEDGAVVDYTRTAKELLTKHPALSMAFDMLAKDEAKHKQFMEAMAKIICAGTSVKVRTTQRESYRTEVEAEKAVERWRRLGAEAWISERMPEIRKFVVTVVREIVK